MKQQQYNEIVRTIQEFSGLSIKCAKYLKKKFSDVSPLALDSILSTHVQNSMKINYNQYKTEEGKHFLYERYIEGKNNNEKAGVLVRLAEELSIAPSLIAKQILTRHVESQVENGEDEEDINVKQIVKKYLQDSSQITDAFLAYEIFLCNLYDNNYGPLQVVRGCVGHEYEMKLYRELRQLGIPYNDEEYLRKLGYDKTPDVKLEIPIAIDNFIIHWIESKARFGDIAVHKEYIKSQYASYWNRFGPGLVIYWFGFINELQNVTEKRFMISDHLPKNIVTLQSLENSTIIEDESKVSKQIL